MFLQYFEAHIPYPKFSKKKRCNGEQQNFYMLQISSLYLRCSDYPDLFLQQSFSLQKVKQQRIISFFFT